MPSRGLIESPQSSVLTSLHRGRRVPRNQVCSTGYFERSE